jgi:hypothetical protein
MIKKIVAGAVFATAIALTPALALAQDTEHKEAPPVVHHRHHVIHHHYVHHRVVHHHYVHHHVAPHHDTEKKG